MFEVWSENILLELFQPSTKNSKFHIKKVNDISSISRWCNKPGNADKRK